MGTAPWFSFKIKYSGAIPEDNPPKWMTDTYEVCARDANLVVANLLKNADFDGEFDYVPYKEFNASGDQCYCNYFSGGLAQKARSKPFVFLKVRDRSNTSQGPHRTNAGH